MLLGILGQVREFVSPVCRIFGENIVVDENRVSVKKGFVCVNSFFHCENRGFVKKTVFNENRVFGDNMVFGETMFFGETWFLVKA